MKDFLDLAMSRRSVRKYTEKEIPDEDITYFIKAASYAPSGCNSQCWEFVAVRDRGLIRQIEEAVVKKLEDLLDVRDGVSTWPGVTKNYLAAKRKMVSFFTKAPVVIAVFMTKAHFYDQTMIDVLKQKGYDQPQMLELYANYDVLSVGAAIQNMLLAIHQKGYGACWMNEPVIAAKEIHTLLNVPEEHRFISLIPVGDPAYIPRHKDMKPFDEIFKSL